MQTYTGSIEKANQLRTFHLWNEPEALVELNQLILQYRWTDIEYLILKCVTTRKVELQDYRDQNCLEVTDPLGLELASAEEYWQIDSLLHEVADRKLKLSSSFEPHVLRWLEQSKTVPELLSTCCFFFRFNRTFDEQLASVIYFFLRSSCPGYGLEQMVYLHDCGMRFSWYLQSFLKSRDSNVAGKTVTVIEHIFRFTSYDISLFAEPLAELLHERIDIRTTGEVVDLANFFELRKHPLLAKELQLWIDEQSRNSSLILE